MGQHKFARVYALLNAQNEVFYIGESVQEKRRLYEHKQRFGDDIKMEIIVEVVYEWRLWWEDHYINVYKDKGCALKNKTRIVGYIRKPNISEIKYLEKYQIQLTEDERRITKNIGIIKQQKKLIDKLLLSNEKLRSKLKERLKVDNGDLDGIKRNAFDEVLLIIKNLPSPLYLKTTVDAIKKKRQEYHESHILYQNRGNSNGENENKQI